MIWFAPSQFSSSLLEVYEDDPEDTEETQPGSRPVSQRSDPSRINLDDSEEDSEESA
jgi:hypothetical protein